MLILQQDIIYHQNIRDITIVSILYLVDDRVYEGFYVRHNKFDQVDIPMVIYCRGGTGDIGSFVSDEKYFLPMIKIASLGYAVFSSNRMGPKDYIDAAKDEVGGHDLLSIYALPEIAKNFSNIKQHKIALIGASSGGMAVYQALRDIDSMILGCAIVISGVANMRRSHELRPELRDIHQSLFPLTNDNYSSRSVVDYFEKIPKDVPLLLLHGMKDKSVSVQDSLDVASLYAKADMVCRIKCYENGDHFLFRSHGFDVFSEIRYWLEQHIS